MLQAHEISYPTLQNLPNEREQTSRATGSLQLAEVMCAENSTNRGKR
jgi:hypothetical protein